MKLAVSGGPNQDWRLEPIWFLMKAVPLETLREAFIAATTFTELTSFRAGLDQDCGTREKGSAASSSALFIKETNTSGLIQNSLLLAVWALKCLMPMPPPRRQQRDAGGQ